MSTKRRKGKATLPLTLLAALATLLALAGSTYAWFTFRPYTNVTPLSGTVSGGEGSLLICASQDGEFKETCSLSPADPGAELLPISTADLSRFYAVKTQDPAGMALTYAQAEDRAEKHTLRGSVYLKADGAAQEVYLWRDSLDCGRNAQALASMRLGLVFHTAGGAKTYIFKLDELGSTDGAEKRATVPGSRQVVESISAAGAPTYTEDPARTLSEFAAGGTAEEIKPGSRALCTLQRDEVARVDFRLYLEGCDENCVNAAQGRDIALRLGFAGISAG